VGARTFQRGVWIGGQTVNVFGFGVFQVFSAGLISDIKPSNKRNPKDNFFIFSKKLFGFSKVLRYPFRGLVTDGNEREKLLDSLKEGDAKILGGLSEGLELRCRFLTCSGEDIVSIRLHWETIGLVVCLKE
jgi:hypothetical protein